MKTLLIDLDDTLLTNPSETYFPAYLNALTQELSEHADPTEMARLILSDKYGLMSNQDPGVTLAERFIPGFYEDINIDYEVVRDKLDHFFKEKIKSLRPLTQERPEAITLINTAIEQGWQVAIATNPVYPLDHTLNRLEWAGLPHHKYDFLTISAYEEYHFTKPDPAYYAEILAQSGWPEGPVVMVGNDKVADIQGAQELELATFWITENPEKAKSFKGHNSLPSTAGWLDEVLAWLDSIPEEELTPSFNTPHAFIAILKSTAAALHTLTRNISEDLWQKTPAPSEWNLTQLVCHLRDVDKDINLPRLNTLQSEENPFIVSVDSDAWAEERQYHLENGPKAFEEFMQVRKEFVHRLEDFTEEDWNKPARHSIFGPTDIKELIKIITQHDRLHIQQAHKLLKQN